MTFRGTTTTSLDVVRDLIEEVEKLKRQVGSIKQNTIRLSDWVVEMESDTVIKTTNLTTGAVSYIGLPVEFPDTADTFDQEWSYSGIVKPSSESFGQRWPVRFACTVNSLYLTLVTASSNAYTVRTWVNGVVRATSVLTTGDTQEEYQLGIPLLPGQFFYPSILTNASGTGTQMGITYRITEG